MEETEHVETETTETTEVVHDDRKSSLLTDILTIIGFAILFIIIIWGLVHLVELISSSFSSSKPAPTIRVNAPSQAISGQPVNVTWNYTPTAEGSYAYLYQCQKGLTFNMGTSTSPTASIPCGVAYSTPGTNNSLTITPLLAATSSVQDTIYIIFIPRQGGTHIQGSASITVNPAAKTTPSTPTKPVKKPSTSGSYGSGSGSYSYTGTYNAGPADLSVQIISANVDQNGNGVVTFDIGNIGGRTSLSYTFSAQLPTSPAIPYVSPLQAPLNPGDHIVNTLRFTQVAPGGGTFSVSIMDGGDVNAGNDYATTQLSAPYYNNNYNQQPYLQYPAPTYNPTPTYTY